MPIKSGENSDDRVDPCKKFACEWQYCLQKNNYKEEKCAHLIEKLKECCRQNYTTDGKRRSEELNVSSTCSGFV